MCKRQIEQSRHFDGVVIEHLIEVAKPEEEDLVRMLCLYLLILPHHRGDRILPTHDPAPQ